MARRDDRGAATPEVIDDGDAERAAFNGIGARSHLVEQHERRRRQLAIHRGDVGNVRRESAQARFDRLLVADVGEQRPEYRQARSVRGGNAQPGLRHHRQQAGRLQRHGLSAGVRPGDEENRRRRDHLDRHRHWILEQRMPRRLQLERPVGRERRLDPVN